LIHGLARVFGSFFPLRFNFGFFAGRAFQQFERVMPSEPTASDSGSSLCSANSLSFDSDIGSQLT
jgi:hypothetical protein